jgi:hypothetical protein
MFECAALVSLLAGGAVAEDRWEAVQSGPFVVYTTGS